MIHLRRMLDALVAFVQLQEGIAQFQSIKISLTKAQTPLGHRSNCIRFAARLSVRACVNMIEPFITWSLR